ncbi:hypothetical protein NOV72_01084 [Caballeronia novacaledonica]|uniref:Uncharacterized protein n=1 Tax=Caballeronia novacaledonica TaxID=1544861 RepID=A0A2U3I137_9BURK|nr:hypothetical protein [Caballeronia novacaledonica]SPB13819.1 hypothetical protein NOV72_01084 [Caballeronia novacaledonica]
MTISNLSIPSERIDMVGGRLTTAPAGHHFDLSFRVEVKPRMLGRISGEDIECPVLQWNERIEWFDYDSATQKWRFVGDNSKDMYEYKPTSHTFRVWHSYRYLLATDVTNNPPAELKALSSDEEAKRWIARNGFAWNLAIRDVPAMGILGGSGGGGGDSLVTGDTRRRVIYFDLGFSGHAQRARCVQILETQQGQLTICHLIRGEIQKATVDHPDNLERWRFQLRTGHQ